MHKWNAPTEDQSHYILYDLIQITGKSLPRMSNHTQKFSSFHFPDDIVALSNVMSIPLQ